MANKSVGEEQVGILLVLCCGFTPIQQVTYEPYQLIFGSFAIDA